MFCGNCGIEIKDGMAFCPKCGTAVKDVDELSSSSTDESKAFNGENTTEKPKKSRRGLKIAVGMAAVLAVFVIGILGWTVFERKTEHSVSESNTDTEKEIDVAEKYHLPPKGTVLFETEYEIVDYCANRFIVKNDGDKYGMLDEEGSIVIPLNYDMVEFSQIVKSFEEFDSLMVEAKDLVANEDLYDTFYLFDWEGKKILDQVRDAHFYLDGENGDSVIEFEWDDETKGVDLLDITGKKFANINLYGLAEYPYITKTLWKNGILINADGKYILQDLEGNTKYEFAEEDMYNPIFSEKKNVYVIGTQGYEIDDIQLYEIDQNLNVSTGNKEDYKMEISPKRYSSNFGIFADQALIYIFPKDERIYDISCHYPFMSSNWMEPPLLNADGKELIPAEYLEKTNDEFYEEMLELTFEGDTVLEQSNFFNRYIDAVVVTNRNGMSQVHYFYAD